MTTVALDEYLAGLLDQLQASMLDAGHGASVTHDLDPLQMSTDASVNLGVVVAEWVTNAFKYAYADMKGEIRVKLKGRTDGRGELIVEDDGVGRTSSRQGHGARNPHRRHHGFQHAARSGALPKGQIACRVALLALGLQAQGLKVGLLDADIYGPSQLTQPSWRAKVCR